jgi:cobalt-zinc-cadmium efflux system protein
MGHEHNHGKMKGKKLGISILLNVVITVAQAIGGVFSGSLSLMTDALHNFSDVVALIISYIADKLTQKDYTDEQTFGHKRSEVIAALFNAASLIVIALLLGKEAIVRFNDPVEIQSFWVIVLAGLSILVNGICVLMLKSEADENMNMRSAYLHLFSDMITSIAVMLGGIFMYYFQVYWMDSLLSILIAIYLIYSSFGLLTQTLRVLMQFAPKHLDIKQIEARILAETDIENVHHMHLWQLNDKDIHLDGHIDFKEDISLSQASDVIERVNLVLKNEFHINFTLLKPEFGVKDVKQRVVDER